MFDVILRKAHDICGATTGTLVTYDGEWLSLAASRGLSNPTIALLQRVQPVAGSPPARLMAGESLVQIDDCREETIPAILSAILAADGARTILFIPLRKEQRFLGFISVCRQEVKAFSDQPY